MRALPIAILSLAALAGCGRKSAQVPANDPDEPHSIQIATDNSAGGDKVSLDIPGFAAKIALPTMDLGRHVDLDGIRLAPATQVSGMDIAGADATGTKPHNRVVVRFSSPQAPAALVDYYRRSAANAGYGVAAAGGDALSAARGGKRFALAVAPAGSGSKGTITMSDAE